MLSTSILTVEDAEEIFTIVEHEAATDGGKPVAMVAINAVGDVLLSKTMHGCKGPSFWNAYRKAHTALKFRRATVEFRFKLDFTIHAGGLWVPTTENWSDIDIATAMAHDSNFCAWAGGIPLYNGKPNTSLGPVGAFGISNREELEDHDLAMKCPHRFH